MARLKVTQVRSRIGRKPNQRETLRTLGLKRINDMVVKEDRPEIRGMIFTVKHLVTVEELDDNDASTAASRAGGAGRPRARRSASSLREVEE